MTLANRRAMYRVRNHFHGAVGLLALAAVLGVIGLITITAHTFLGR